MAQFYKKNHIAFAAALLSSLLTSALNLYIAWVLQQMIDAVSGVPGLHCLLCFGSFSASLQRSSY